MGDAQGSSPGGRNIRRKGFKESTIPATGIVDIAFLHEAAAGDTIIDVTNLTVPASAQDYNPPSTADLTKDNLKKIKENVSLESTSGPMIQTIDYVVNGATTIRLLQPAAGGTIFRGLIRSSTRQLTSAADATPLVVSGTLAAGQTDFNVGTFFEVGKFIQQQVGQVLVFEDGQQIWRRVGNQPAGIGDYYEVHAGGGLGTLLRFPASGTDRNILVIAPGGLLKNPTASQDTLIESIASQQETHRTILEEITDIPIPQGGATNADNKAFGDRVLQNEQDIATKQDIFTIPHQTRILSSNITELNTVVSALGFSNLEIGKTYRVTMQAAIQANDGNNVALSAVHDGNIICAVEYENDAGTGSDNMRAGTSKVFTATATTVLFQTSGMVGGGAADALLGDGTLARTFTQLEELTNHEVTTKWT